MEESRMRIGSDSHCYEWVEGWAKVPAHVTLGYTHGVVEDSHGRIYVHHTGTASVIVFDAEGQYLSSWGEEYTAGAHGLHLSQEAEGEFLYLSATGMNVVVKTTLDGHEVYRIGTPDLPEIYTEEKKFVPTETAVAPNGDVYIADGYGQPWVHQYTAKAEYIRSFGGLGSELGKLNNPHGIMIDTSGSEPLVLVADRGNHRLQYFTLEGVAVNVVEGMLRLPCTMVQHDGELYIPDLHSRLTILDNQRQLVTHLGERENGWEIEGWPNIAHDLRQVGNFTSPHGIHVDANGNIYVVEWISDGRITRLERVRT
jgi:DNA-binding beta-propeller fold protein YncE